MDSQPISMESLLKALLSAEVPLPSRFLYRLSDLEKEDLALLEKEWPNIPVQRRQGLMEELIELGESDYVLSFEGLCLCALKDENAKVRRISIEILKEYEQTKLIPVFIRMMETDKAIDVRASAAAALGNFVYLGEIEELPAKTLHQVEDHLLNVLRGADDVLVRRRALEALGFSSREEIEPLIEEAFRSSDQEWLTSALLAMGRSANQRWASQVLAMLDNPRPAVRAEAISAAGELELKRAVPELLLSLRDTDDDVRFAAIWSLSQIGGERVRLALEAMLEVADNDEEIALLDQALDNLEFTEGVQAFSLLDISPEDHIGDEDDWMLDLDEDNLNDNDSDEEEDILD